MGNKTDSHKKTGVPTRLLCRVCKCSPELVRKYRNGKLTGEGMATTRVQIADLLLAEGLENLVAEVSKVLPFNP